MSRKGVTVRDATERWVREFNAIPQGMIDKLMSFDCDDWHEVTPPTKGDRVYVYDEKQIGYIKSCDEESELYAIELDNDKLISCTRDDYMVENDDILPMWGMMWSFSDNADDYWLEELGGLRIMSECGFRIYESDEFGYFFGIDGAGYSFMEAHWEPLYRRRGLRWHDEEMEGEQMIPRETTRDAAKEHLLRRDMNLVMGPDERTVQNQGRECGDIVFGLYDEDGNFYDETTDIEYALDYIGF